jgi:hypothetical protein
MKIICEDTYFLDRDLAYQTALAHNTVTLQDGQKSKQVCYYDGQPFGHAPNNLVHVPAERISDFFKNHGQRIPTHIETTVTANSNADQLQHRLKTVLTAVANLRKNDLNQNEQD